MNAKKRQATFVLYGGIGLIALALVGLVAVVVLDEIEDKEKSEKSVKQEQLSVQLQLEESKTQKTLKEKVEEKEEWVAAVDTTEEMKKILRKQVRQTTKDLNEAWLTEFTQQVSGKAGLQAYYQEKFALGAQFSPKALANKKKKVFSSNPQAFIEQARKEIYGKQRTPDVGKIKKESRGYLALALYKANEQVKGLENANEVFMTSYFKTTIKMYKLLQELEGARGRWRTERVRTYEAYVWERFLRIEQGIELLRQRRAGTFISGEPDLLKIKRMDEQINEILLVLGKIYLSAAEDEIIDRKKLQFYADQAFKALAMVYQRSLSGDAMKTLFAVDRIQKDYLYRMAINSWKRARLAKDDAKYGDVDEHYFRTTQLYYQLMSRWREDQKRLHTDEFFKLKQEIAAWSLKKKKKSASPVAGGG
jgi:hypothetical protein